MKIVYAREFAKEFKKLAVSVQRLYRKQEDIFQFIPYAWFSALNILSIVFLQKVRSAELKNIR